MDCITALIFGSEGGPRKSSNIVKRESLKSNSAQVSHQSEIVRMQTQWLNQLHEKVKNYSPAVIEKQVSFSRKAQLLKVLGWCHDQYKYPPVVPVRNGKISGISTALLNVPKTTFGRLLVIESGDRNRPMTDRCFWSVWLQNRLCK